MAPFFFGHITSITIMPSLEQHESTIIYIIPLSTSTSILIKHKKHKKHKCKNPSIGIVSVSESKSVSTGRYHSVSDSNGTIGHYHSMGDTNVITKIAPNISLQNTDPSHNNSSSYIIPIPPSSTVPFYSSGMGFSYSEQIRAWVDPWEAHPSQRFMTDTPLHHMVSVDRVNTTICEGASKEHRSSRSALMVYCPNYRKMVKGDRISCAM
eukprot:1169674_1